MNTVKFEASKMKHLILLHLDANGFIIVRQDRLKLQPTGYYTVTI